MSRDKNSTLTVTNSELNDHPTKNVNDLHLFIPKDPVVILNELKPGLNFVINSNSEEKLTASIEIDGKAYIGIGKSEITAKQLAAEKALKDLFFDIIISAMTNLNSYSQFNTISWKLLGSFAMFKLIEDWMLYYMTKDPYKKVFETSVPEKVSVEDKSLRSVHKNNKIQKKKLYVDKTLEKKVLSGSTNAVVLLSAIVGSDVQFIDLQTNNNKPPFTFTILMDDKEYIGEPARRKKDAKQSVAKKVLITKYGYQFAEN